MVSRLRRALLALSVAELLILWVVWVYHPVWVASGMVQHTYRSMKNHPREWMPETEQLPIPYRSPGSSGAYDSNGNPGVSKSLVSLNSVSETYTIYLPVIENSAPSIRRQRAGKPSFIPPPDRPLPR